MAKDIRDDIHEIQQNWGMQSLRNKLESQRIHQSSIAPLRKQWIRRNKYYYNCLKKFFAFLVEPGKRVLHLRCRTGFLLDTVKPSEGIGVEISAEMVNIAQSSYPSLKFTESFPEDFKIGRTFDYIIFEDIGDTVDIIRILRNLHENCERHTRLIIHSYNHLWAPLLVIAEKLRIKVPQFDQNWFSADDIEGLLKISGYELLKIYRMLLFPKYIPLFSKLLNGFFAKLPLINRLCFTQILVARPLVQLRPRQELNVSVVIPCKNERGNIEEAVRRIPEMGSTTELVFCDDNSTDGTADEIRRMMECYPDRIIKLVKGPGINKAKNVWTGFDAATGDILIILDGDLTVMPEELPYFVNAIAGGYAEFVNGSRLVYSMPKNAMKKTNLMGNKFFSVVFSYLLDQRVKDTLCGTKVIWRSDWKRIKPLINSWGTVDRWGDYELLFSAAKLNLKILDLPVHYQERVYGFTKMTKVFNNGMNMLKMCYYGFKKLKLGY